MDGRAISPAWQLPSRPLQAINTDFAIGGETHFSHSWRGANLYTMSGTTTTVEDVVRRGAESYTCAYSLCNPRKMASVHTCPYDPIH